MKIILRFQKSGPCYDAKNWTKLESVDAGLIKGFQDLLSGNTTSSDAVKWSLFQTKNKSRAKSIRNQYIVATHGSRSAFILDKFSGGKANLLYIRNMSTGIGGVADQLGKLKNRKKYSNGCGFNNWPTVDMESFKDGSIQPYQQRISTVLKKHKSIKIVNLSLGYKENWIQEDNPKCNRKQVSKEYLVLIKTWTNFINKHPNVLFITAAGNENENFDNPNLFKNDLWANIASKKLENLLLVGSMNSDGTKFRASNFGRIVKVMALGSELFINSPLPGKLQGHPTTVRGTSFSAPLVSGAAVQFLTKTSSPKQLKEKLTKVFF